MITTVYVPVKNPNYFYISLFDETGGIEDKIFMFKSDKPMWNGEHLIKPDGGCDAIYLVGIENNAVKVPTSYELESE